jgi:hypothetical protein
MEKTLFGVFIQALLRLIGRAIKLLSGCVSSCQKIMDTREKRLYIPTIQKTRPGFSGIYPVNGLEPP